MDAAIHTILPPPLQGGGLGVGGLDSLCSIYAHAKDTFGEYFDCETGEVIRQMSIREFLLTDRWQPQVMRLHELIAQHGVKAKKMEEYQNIKRSLPGATLSGVFGEHRRTAECIGRTGYIALDIDTGDNEGIQNWENIRMALRFRPEIEVLMHSCSGQGYLALARLAYPDRIKEQFNALWKEYRAIGINLDRACSDITRLRFATWDAEPFIRPADVVVPYQGVEIEREQTIAPIAAVYRYNGEAREYTDADLLQQAETLVAKCEARHVDLTDGYDEWCHIGWSLKQFGEAGRQLFHRLSSLNPEYTAGATDRKWRELGESSTITFQYLKKRCKDRDVWIWR